MATDQPEIPRAEQEADMPDAPGYLSGLLATLVIVVMALVIFGLLALLMLAINPIQVREGAPKRERPPVQVPFTPSTVPEAPKK
jgi:hypothetical protein